FFNLFILVISILITGRKAYCSCKGEKHYIHLKQISVPRYLLISEKIKKRVYSGHTITTLIKQSEYDDSLEKKYVNVDLEICSTCGYKKVIFSVIEYDPLISNYREVSNMKDEYIISKPQQYPNSIKL
ncbi:MAG: hypothetical protein V3575_05610, partial [Candidatus Absconditabacteria bacterium]